MTTIEAPISQPPLPDSVTTEVALPQLSETAQALNLQLESRGDTLDRIKSLRRVTGVGTLAVGLAVVGTNGGLFPLAADTAAGTFSMLFLAGAASTVARKYGRHRQRTSVAEVVEVQHELQQAFDGEVVEVFCSKHTKRNPERRAVLWNGNEEIDEPLSDYLLERLKQLRAVADGVDADEVGVPKEYLADFIDEEQNVGCVKTFNEWLKDYKKLSLVDKKHGKDQIHFVDRDELDELINSIEASSQSEEPLRSIMKVLAHYKPAHSAHKWYGARSNNPAQADKRLKGLFRNVLERRLQDVERTRDVDDDFIPEVSKVHTFGRVRSSNGRAKIDWHQAEKRLHVATSDLLGQFKLTYSDLQQILSHPESFSPAKVVELCELAAWLTLEGHDIGIVAENGGHAGLNSTLEEVSAVDAMSFGERGQQQLLGTKSGRKIHKEDQDIDESRQYMKRLWRAAALVALAGYSTIMGGRLSNNYARDQRLEHEVATHDYNSDFYADSSDPIIRAYAGVINGFDAYHGVNNAIASAIGQRLGIQYSPLEMDSLQRTTSPPSGSEDQDTDVGVGNVNPNGENKPMWYIQSYGGMDSTGYWTENTYNRLKWRTVDWEDDFGSPQDPDSRERALQQSAAIPAQPDNVVDPHLRVQRLLNFSRGTSSGYPELDILGQTHYKRVNVPIKEGTRIAAASINGRDGVKVYTMTDGLQILLVPSDFSDPFPKLEYWLAPSSDAPRPKFKEAPNFHEFDSAGTDKPGTLMAELNRLWQPLVPDLPAGGMDRVAKQQAYIREQFDYELAPLHQPKITEDRARYAGYVLTNKEANCNIAATLLAMSNPDELNLATGYDNGDQNEDGSAHLGSHEAHAWTIDKAGVIHDATPVKGVSESEEDFFKEDFDEKEPTSEREQQLQRVLIAAKLAVLAAAATAAYRKRKQIRGLKVGTQRRLAERTLREASQAELSTAAATLNYAAFAPDSDNLREVLQTKLASPEAELESIESLSTDSYKDTKQTLQRVVAITKQEKKAKQLAKRLARAAYLAHR